MKTEIENKTVEPGMGKLTVYDRIREGLAVASQLIIASPLGLPAKVVAVAKYVALALGVLKAVERTGKRKGSDEK